MVYWGKLVINLPGKPRRGEQRPWGENHQQEEVKIFNNKKLFFSAVKKNILKNLVQGKRASPSCDKKCCTLSVIPLPAHHRLPLAPRHLDLKTRQKAHETFPLTPSSRQETQPAKKGLFRKYILETLCAWRGDGTVDGPLFSVFDAVPK